MSIDYDETPMALLIEDYGGKELSLATLQSGGLYMMHDGQIYGDRYLRQHYKVYDMPDRMVFSIRDILEGDRDGKE